MTTPKIFKTMFFFFLTTLLLFGQPTTDQTDDGAVPQTGPAIGRASFLIDGTLGSGSPSWPSTSGDQLGRLNRNGVPSTCAVPKVCAIFTSSGLRAYDAYTLGATGCVTVELNVLTQTGANYQVNAYVGSYDPANICDNYLADPGTSTGIPPTQLTMSFEVPAGQEMVLVVHTTNPGEIGGDYELTISGNISAGVPTLGQWGLMAFIGLFLTFGVAFMVIQKRRAI